MRRSPSRRRGGFTLMEVLLVLAILVILASLVTFTFTNVLSDSDRKAARAQIGALETPLSAYFLDMKEFPSTSQGLAALRAAPSDARRVNKWNGPYLQKDLPADPWDSPYQYQYPGKRNADSYDVWSLGPDGQDGTEDDIGNWTVAE
jgi:general secretion pathway protein G